MYRELAKACLLLFCRDKGGTRQLQLAAVATSTAAISMMASVDGLRPVVSMSNVNRRYRGQLLPLARLLLLLLLMCCLGLLRVRGSAVAGQQWQQQTEV